MSICAAACCLNAAKPFITTAESDKMLFAKSCNVILIWFLFAVFRSILLATEPVLDLVLAQCHTCRHKSPQGIFVRLARQLAASRQLKTDLQQLSQWLTAVWVAQLLPCQDNSSCTVTQLILQLLHGMNQKAAHLLV